MPFVRAGDGVRLHYRVTGRRTGPPVLMIQGLGADKHGWDLQRLALAPWYRTIAFDKGRVIGMSAAAPRSRRGADRSVGDDPSPARVG